MLRPDETWWVTSSRTIVASSPLAETRAAASGSAPDELGHGVSIALGDRPAHQNDTADPAGGGLRSLLEQPGHVREQPPTGTDVGLGHLGEEVR